jgi:hypothetical protein
MEAAMSTIHFPPLPMPRAGGDRNLLNPRSIRARVGRLLDVLRERCRRDHAAEMAHGRRPPVPTFFAFDVLDLVGGGRAWPRKDRW